MNFLLFRLMKRKLGDTLNPSFITVQYALRVTLITFISLMVVHFSSLTEDGWIFVSAGFISTCYRGPTHLQRFLSIFMTGIVFCVAAVIMTLVGQWLWLYASVFFILILLAYKVTNAEFDQVLTRFLNLVYIAILGSMPGDIHEGLRRLLGTAIGFAIAFVAVYVIWPYRPQIIVAKLTQNVKQKTAYYLYWTLNEFACGNTLENLSLQLHDEILCSVQAAFKLLSVYPNEAVLLELRNAMDFFGQVSILSRLLSSPHQKQDANLLLESVDKIKNYQLRLFQQKNEDEKINIDLQQKLHQLLDDLQQQSNQHKDLQSICYVLRNLSLSITRGKNDATHAFA